MDIGKINLDGEWLELETESVDLGILRIKVYPENTEGASFLWKNDVAGYIATVIVGWNLKDGDKDIPCDKENKAKYLPVLSSLRIKNPRHRDENIAIHTVGSEVLAFSKNISNFTKN